MGNVRLAMVKNLPNDIDIIGFKAPAGGVTLRGPWTLHGAVVII